MLDDGSSLLRGRVKGLSSGGTVAEGEQQGVGKVWGTLQVEETPCVPYPEAGKGLECSRQSKSSMYQSNCV